MYHAHANCPPRPGFQPQACSPSGSVNVDEALALLALLACAVAVFGIARYGTPLNPLTFYTVTQMGVLTLISGFVAVRLDPFGTLNPAAATKTAMISLAHLCGTALPFAFRGGGPARVFGQLLALVGLTRDSRGRRFSLVKLALIMLAAVACFVALAVVGGGGLLWLTSSRQAYQFHRAGAGPFFAATQWAITFGMVYTLWATRPGTVRTALVVTLFCAATYLLGSKAFIVTLVIVGVAYRHFMVRPVPAVVYLVGGPLLLAAVVGLQIAQGTALSLVDTALYFREYFATSAEFINRFQEFGHLYGGGALSSLWFFVPRGLYPDKPYEYGVLLIHRVVFPGAAEMGHTPGILPWALAYLDFGVFGVFLHGVVSGLWLRMSYEYFLGHRESLMAFVLMIHLSITGVFWFAPLPVLVVLTVAQVFFLRLAPWAPAGSAQPPAGARA